MEPVGIEPTTFGLQNRRSRQIGAMTPNVDFGLEHILPDKPTNPRSVLTQETEIKKPFLDGVQRQIFLPNGYLETTLVDTGGT